VGPGLRPGEELYVSGSAGDLVAGVLKQPESRFQGSATLAYGKAKLSGRRVTPSFLKHSPSEVIFERHFQPLSSRITRRAGSVSPMMFRRLHAAVRKFPDDVFIQKSSRFRDLLQRGIHVGERQTADEQVRLFAGGEFGDRSHLPGKPR
jgi:hypothetical protein